MEDHFRYYLDGGFVGESVFIVNREEIVEVIEWFAIRENMTAYEYIKSKTIERFTTLRMNGEEFNDQIMIDKYTTKLNKIETNTIEIQEFFTEYLLWGFDEILGSSMTAETKEQARKLYYCII